jgi:hypothetical protein
MVSSLGEADELMLGLPLPSLAMEQVIQSTVLPLGRLVMLVGIEKVGKSGFFFEMVRWFRKHHGFGALLEHESKWNPKWASSIIGWDEPDALIHIPCRSIEGWQTALSGLVKDVKKEMIGDKKNVRPGKTWPFIVGVDSIMGKSSETTQKKIEESGHSQKHWADEARAITDYMRFIPQRIVRWPFLLVGVNHLKPRIDPKTHARHRDMAGGRGVNFQESIELELNWARGKKSSKIKLADRRGFQLRLSCENNSYGEGLRDVNVNVWMWQEEVEHPKTGRDTWVNRTVWDWHGATVAMLMKTCAAGGEDAKRVREVLRIQKVNTRGGSMYYARALGISKKDPVEIDVLGQMVHKDKEMLQALRKIYGVVKWPVFRPGEDFDEQLIARKKQMAAATIRVHKKRKPEAASEPTAPRKRRAAKKRKLHEDLSPPPKSVKKRRKKPRERT